MTNIYTNTENTKAIAIASAWSLLTNWDEKIGGSLPTIENIEAALTVMSKPGGRSAQLNQGVRALVLGFRPEGSTDGQRQYASMVGAPHNNIGKCGDALRAQFGSSRLETGRVYDIKLPGGMVHASAIKAGHIALTLGEVLPQPEPAAPVKAPKAAKKAKKAKAAKDASHDAVITSYDDAANLASVDESTQIAGNDATV